MEDRKKPKVGLIPCLTFVKQGVANTKQEKIRASKDEMKQIVKELRLREAEFRNRPGAERVNLESAQQESDADVENQNDVDDYYDLDNYDEEPVEPGMSSNTDTMLLSAPESEIDDDSDEDAEECDVRPDDNIIVAGHVSDDVCLLQLYVLNVERQEFFLLNDTYLPSYPLALEWLDFNPKDSNAPAHLAAVGFMEPEIQVWDLNLADCLEPSFCLGSKKQKKTLRHNAAVMDLAWNTGHRHMLASGSADNTVILWDLNTCKSVHRMECFEEKVQTVMWHPVEAQNLLTGVCNGNVKLFDCRSPGTHNASWNFEGEVERVLWNKFDPVYFLTSTEKGMVHYVDIRAQKPLWNLKAHDGSVGGLALSSFCSELMVTGSEDEKAKVWDLKGDSPTLVTSKELNIGHIYAISSCPDSPYVFSAGGAKAANHLYVWDIRENASVVERFQDRLSTVVSQSVISTLGGAEPMDDDSAGASASSFQYTELKRKSSSSSRPKTDVKALSKKKKKKKKNP